MMPHERVPPLVLKAQRDPALRRHHAPAVYAEIYGYLRLDEPRPVKVRASCSTMQVERGTFRRALQLLEESRYIALAFRDSRGIRHYVLLAEQGPTEPPFGRASTPA